MKTSRKYLPAIALFLALAATGVQAQGTDVCIGSPEQNVLYAGLDNPLILQASGIAHDNLLPTCDGARVFERNGVWYVHPQKNDSTDWITVNIFRKKADGQNVFVADKLFRVMKNPEQLACIVTPARVYRPGERVPVSELTDENTRIEPKYPEYIDYRESDLAIEQFTLMCQQKLILCTNDTLSVSARSMILESLAERDETVIVIEHPRIGKRTDKSVTKRMLQRSTFTIVDNRKDH